MQTKPSNVHPKLAKLYSIRNKVTLLSHYSQQLKTPISIEELLYYCLTLVPDSLGTPDGFMSKTDKAKLMHHIIEKEPDAAIPNPGETLWIDDGNAVIHALKGLPKKF